MASTSDTKAAMGAMPPFTSDPSLAPFATSMAAYLATNAGFEGLATGALVFFSASTDDPSNAAAARNEDRILLVQRAPHDSMPLRWEVPGGACDDEDETVLHAVARELREESGLRAVRIGPQVGEGMPFFTRRGRRMLKVSFLADVVVAAAAAANSEEEEEGEEGVEKRRPLLLPPAVKLDPEEHVAFLWASEEECRNHRVGETEIQFTHDAQEQTILEGFRLRRELRARGGVMKVGSDVK